MQLVPFHEIKTSTIQGVISCSCNITSGIGFGAASNKDKLNQNKEQSTCQNVFFFLTGRLMRVVKIKKKKRKEKRQYLCIGQKLSTRGNKFYVTMLLGSLSSSVCDLFGSFKNILKW